MKNPVDFSSVSSRLPRRIVFLFLMIGIALNVAWSQESAVVVATGCSGIVGGCGCEWEAEWDVMLDADGTLVTPQSQSLISKSFVRAHIYVPGQGWTVGSWQEWPAVGPSNHYKIDGVNGLKDSSPGEYWWWDLYVTIGTTQNPAIWTSSTVTMPQHAGCIPNQNY